MSFFRDLRVTVRSLVRVPALWITVALTLALGIGANAAIFSVVRAVLLRPLANRDEDRLLYLRQSAPGIGPASAHGSQTRDSFRLLQSRRGLSCILEWVCSRTASEYAEGITGRISCSGAAS
jgi:hypothetical protein